MPPSNSFHSAARRYDAVICDIDGCLAPESSDPIDVGSLAKLAEHNRRAQERGDRPVVTVCSGRPEPFAEAICRLLANRTIPAIAENGVWLYHPADNGWDRDPTITAEHLRAVGEAARWVESELGPRGVVMQPGKVASISLYHRDTEFLKSLEPRVKEEFKRRGWPLRVSMTWFYINCDLAHVSKATALDRFMRSTGLTRDRLAGIGDTLGDTAIADKVAFFACPSNAVQGIKERAHYISPKAEAVAVVDIVERLSIPDTV
jgi:hydroxymethylpyrimidine pyrophosphatase-like HAD family hydrolase